MSNEALVPEDVNGIQDVYEWSDGRASLISAGRGATKSYLFAMSPDGDDVFFTTPEKLVPQDDVEAGWSIYDARVGGGFPQPQPLTPCEGEGCQGAVAIGPSLFSPASEGVVPSLSPGGLARKCPKGKRKVRRHGKVRCVKTGHRKRHHANRRASR